MSRIVDVIVLAVLLISSTLLAFHPHLPRGAPAVLEISEALAVAGPLALLFLRRLQPLILRRLPARVATRAEVVTVAMIASVRRMPLLVLLLVESWLGETLMLIFVVLAIGNNLPITHAPTVGLLTALLMTLPITPGDLGSVDTGIIFLLRTVSIAAGPAAAIAILFRVKTFGSVVLIDGLWTLFDAVRERSGTPPIFRPVTDESAVLCHRAGDRLTTPGTRASVP